MLKQLSSPSKLEAKFTMLFATVFLLIGAPIADAQNPDFLYRLSTQFRGTGMPLDVFNGGPNYNQPHLTKCVNYSGQFWQLSPTNKPVQ